MPPLTDPEKLQCYRNALANWRYEGFITFAKDALRWLHLELTEYSTRDIGKLLLEFLLAGGEIDQQVETRPHWRNLHEFHYDIRIPMKGRLIYFETRLIAGDPDDPDDSQIDVVNIHDA